jgi:hypothetical protein
MLRDSRKRKDDFKCFCLLRLPAPHISFAPTKKPNPSMKRTFFISASFILVMGASKVNAQLANYTVTAPNLTENATVADNKSTAVAGVSTTISENFSKNFPGVSNVVWTKADKTTWGYFKEQGVPVRASYNEKGKLLYTIRYYNQSQVSPDLQRTIVKEGYSMPIVHVTEIKSRYNTTSLVKLEDNFSIVTLKVGANGDVTVYEELTKG